MASLVGTKLKLKDKMLSVGSLAPNFLLTNIDLDDLSLEHFRNKRIKIISTFPSINTSVCDLQTKKFNQLFANRDDIVVINVSMDLPFAFKNWCDVNNMGNNIVMLSDYKTHQFGKSYGVLIADFNLLYRACFVLDEENKLVYFQYANSIADNLNFDEVINFINKL